ncbi:MAG: SUF system Fe-S cluster assembly protein [Gammaproteobacteria bacterium]|nr:MAG: SUF system Fe-S cluster assembly protein [Gammaproteobacteria bacterium]
MATAETNPENLGHPSLEQRVVDALSAVYDPEIPVNIYDLGLIYNVEIDSAGVVNIQMTLTAPGCPVAQTFPGTVECAVKSVPGVTDARVELVWDPPWTQDRMSEAARLQLGLI